jgi:hypothetical protein
MILTAPTQASNATWMTTPSSQRHCPRACQQTPPLRNRGFAPPTNADGAMGILLATTQVSPELTSDGIIKVIREIGLVTT